MALRSRSGGRDENRAGSRVALVAAVARARSCRGRPRMRTPQAARADAACHLRCASRRVCKFRTARQPQLRSASTHRTDIPSPAALRTSACRPCHCSTYTLRENHGRACRRPSSNERRCRRKARRAQALVPGKPFRCPTSSPSNHAFVTSRGTLHNVPVATDGDAEMPLFATFACTYAL